MLCAAFRKRTQRLAFEINYDGVPAGDQYLAEMVIPVVPGLRECGDRAGECLQALNHLVAVGEKRTGETSGLRVEACPAGETAERAAGRCLRGHDPAFDIVPLD